MTVSFDKARKFVFENGSLWERALFSHLFEGDSIDRVHQCLLCYKNKDGGFGHGLEYDIKCPDSNPLALEFLLSIIRDTGIPVGNLLDGTVEWVEKNQKEDGSLKNPSSLLDFPRAPWWSDGGQSAPDSITGNLMKLGVCSKSLAETTAKWVENNLTVNGITQNDWLFGCYHAFDYFMNVGEIPGSREGKEATIQNITNCAKKASEKEYFVLFHFANTPDSEIAKKIPPEIINKFLDHLSLSQREDGGWNDEHGLAYWQPYMSIVTLLALKNFNRI